MVGIATLCGNCGNASRAGEDKFCRECGSALHRSPPDASHFPTEANLAADRPHDEPESSAPGPHYAPPQTQKQSTNGFAVAALVLGIIPVAGIGGILALVFGYKGRKQIDESNGEQTGRGMATAGIALGWVWTVFLIAILVIAIVALVGGQTRKRVGTAATFPFSAATTPATEPTVTTPWHPADYQEVPGSPGFAYKFVANVNNLVCDPGTSCWNVRVIPRSGCSSGITIDLSIEDSNGTAIGTATDTFTGEVRPGQAALLRPTDTSPTAATDTDNAQVSSISGDNGGSYVGPNPYAPDAPTTC